MDTITFTLKKGGKVPLYSQLYEFIKKEIQSGKILHDEKLPSKRKLSEHLNISQNTIQAAYDKLIEEGYATAVEKSGFYVSCIENIVQFENMVELDLNITEFKETNIKYDFSYDGIDEQAFPFSIWGRITREVIGECHKEMLKIGDPKGNLQLRRSIAKYLYHSRGVNCDADQIIISGGIEFLVQILIQMFDRNKVYGIENPGYERLKLLFESNHSNFKAIEIDDEGMMPKEIIKSKADIILVAPSHQFPSGCIMPPERRAQLINWANEKSGRYIIEDDYDSEFKYRGKPIPALQGLDSNEKVIYMGAFSKSLAPSIRLSYMVLPKGLMKNYADKLSYLVCPVPSIEQNVMYRFIRDGYFERHLNKMRNIYKRKRETLVEEISKISGNIEIIGADAGLHLLLKINNGMTEKQLISSALKKGVRVSGISKFYFEDGYFEKTETILLGYATLTKTEIVNAVRLLQSAWF